MVLGPPGSGKSSFSRRLGDRLRLPVFHLDQVFWRPGWVQAPNDEVRAEIDRLAARPAWIMDGNYTFHSESRLRAADTLVILDVSPVLSTVRVVRRSLMDHGRVRQDGPPGCPERLNLAFLRFAWTWQRRNGDRMHELATTFPGRVIALSGPQPRDAADRL